MASTEDDNSLTLGQFCRKFIEEQRIYDAETVYQSDRVIENAYSFITGVCDILGYMKRSEEDDDV